MTKPELFNLVEKAIENINIINSAFDEVYESKQAIEKIQENITNKFDETWKVGLLEEIETKRGEVEDKYNEIINIHYDLLKDDEENESIKTQLNNLVKKFNSHNKIFEQVNDDFFGSKDTNEDGEEIEKIGYIEKIKNEIKNSQNKISELEKKINKELISGATTISLSNTFKEKAKEYKKTRKAWEWTLVTIMIVTIGYSIFAINIITTGISQLLINFIPHIPVFTFIVWLIVFTGNRRAENKKLEESYTHKAVISQSFTGYKESIENLDDNDNKLLIVHMNNLLSAISQDSGAFLSSKGENHPAAEVIKTVVSKATSKND